MNVAIGSKVRYAHGLAYGDDADIEGVVTSIGVRVPGKVATVKWSDGMVTEDFVTDLRIVN